MNQYQELGISELIDSLDLFREIYETRPIRDNSGGMGLDHSWATWHLLTMLQPKLIIESGVWRGHSTWLLEKACPNASILCFEPNIERIEYKSKKAEYFSHDFSQHDWKEYKTGLGLCFFDDHQNSYSRLMQMKWFGFSRAIFEDNPYPGDGDFYSINHILAGTGAPSLQMNPSYFGGISARSRRFIKEMILKRIGNNQNLIVLPNDADKSNMMMNISKLAPIKSIYEFSKEAVLDERARKNYLVYLEIDS